MKSKTSTKEFADSVRGLLESHDDRLLPKNSRNTEPSDTDELRKWAKLLNDGIVTQEEFDIRKRQPLGLDT